MPRDTQERIAEAVADAARERRTPSFHPPGLSKALDHWLSKAFGVLLIGLAGGGGGSLLAPEPAIPRTPHPTVETGMAEFERKIGALERRIDGNSAVGMEVETLRGVADQLAIMLLREKAADLAPRRSLRMKYADRAAKRYEGLVERGMPRVMAIREVTYRLVD